MRIFKVFIHVLLLITTPAFLVYPYEVIPNFIPSTESNEQSIENTNELSYDQILLLLEKIESGDLEKECSVEELEKIKHFIAFLAKEGFLPNDFEESRSLDEDVEELLNGNDDSDENIFSLENHGEYKYVIIPAVTNDYVKIILCKSWIKKQCKHIKKFIKKHKKAIIIGAVVVAAVVVVVAVVAVSAAAAGTGAASAGGAAGAASADSDKSDKKDRKEDEGSSISQNPLSSVEETQKVPGLQEVMKDQITAFKDSAISGQFFESFNQDQILSLEETGRSLGSLLAHASLNDISKQIPYNPQLIQEIQNLGSNPFLVDNKFSPDLGHFEIDKQFSTDYSYLFSNSDQEIDFNALSYQVCGEKALEYGYYDQAIQDLGKAIKINPARPIPYLERGIAHLGTGQYDLSLEDYHQFTLQSQQSSTTYPLSVPEFSLGFAKGLPKGIYDSGSGLFLFISDLVKHPINTGKQMWEALTLLSHFAQSEEWGTLSKALAPEVHQLVKEWNDLPSDKRGELAGYAFGKYGADIIIPGALMKAVSEGLKGAREFSAVYKSLQTAEQTLVLESIADLGNSAKVGEVIKANQTVLALGEDLGFDMGNMAQLKQAGNLEDTISRTFENISRNPAMRESYEKFERAQNFLKSYKGFMSEMQCKELIEKTGISTFPRPTGIPENFRVRIADKGAGMVYVHPEHAHTSIRIMPGKPHSPFLYQQKPYVIYRKNGKALDKFGHIVDSASCDAHIPLEEFVYQD